MAQTACFTNIFTVSDVITSSNNNIRVAFQGVLVPPSNNGRPFIPYCGAVLNVGNGLYTPDTVANNILFINTFVDFFKECRQASINMVQDIGPPASQYQSELYQGYLYKQTFANTAALQRYLQNAAIVFDFWTNANPAWTNEQYFNALTGLRNKIASEADKMLYIPNGDYTFAPASPIAVDLAAWLAGNVSFAGLLCVEFYQ